MEFEEAIKEIVEQNYGGDSNKFLRSLRHRTILFLLTSGFGFILSLALYNDGYMPYLLTTLSTIVFVIGVISHRLYNQCYRFLNK